MSQEQRECPKAAFYCVSSREYFLGAVGLINSLRLLGHDEPVYLLDRGLTPAQRQLVTPHATVVPAPRESVPYMLKAVGPLANPAEVMVLIDVDMILTRPLTPLIEEASRGKVVAFEVAIDRFFPEWGELLGLGPARRLPYLGSGLVCLDRALGTRVLRLMEDHGSRVDFSVSYWRDHVADRPFLYADQDLLNAILATSVERERVVALEPRLAPIPPFRGLRVVDEGTLRCTYDDGTEPYLLHHYYAKPWLQRTYHGPYSRLLARLLLDPDVAVRVPEEQIPLRMRRGPRALAERTRVNIRELVRWYAGDALRARMDTGRAAVRRWAGSRER
jgi:hypothetical protein